MHTTYVPKSFGGDYMGRDEHKKSRGKRHLAQTPKQQLSDGIDIEFSEELTVKDAAKTNEHKQHTENPSKKK